jgi:ribose/xylose/arabinose/galactoside ABC-type transport system permease subunit
MQQALVLRRLGSSILPTLVIGLACLLAIVMFINAPTFFRLNNLTNILVQASAVGLLAVGMSFVMVGGGIDLSMPSVLALSGIVGVICMRDTGSVWIGPVVMIGVGALVGAFNGIAVARLRMAPFVVTLATMTVVGGLAVWLTGGQSVTGYPDAFEDLVLNRVAGLPMSVWVFIIATAIATFAISKTSFGRFLHATGFNANAALIARVPVRGIWLLTYMLSGAFAGLTSVMLVARLGSASPSLGSDSLLLDIITSCVIGRISIYGGVGRPLNAALGAILVTLISNSMNQLGVSYFASLVIKGVAIVLFVYVDKLVRERT